MTNLDKPQPTPLQLALNRRVLARSAVVAIVVGTTLNMINQGDRVLTGVPINLPKLALTYAVPFIVSTYGACSMAKSMLRKK